MTNKDLTPDDQPTTPITPEAPATAPAAGGQPAQAMHSGAAPVAPDAAPGGAASSYAPTPLTPKRRGRTALIAGGAVLGAAVLVGGGIALGAALSDDDDDDAREASFVADDGRGGEAGNGAGGDSDGSGSNGSSSNGTGSNGTGTGSNGGTTDSMGAASADDLIAVADAASGVASGSVISIDANRDGSWDVQLVGDDGTETEVLVDASGNASVRETDAADGDDTAPQNVLDAATLRTMVDAALAEAEGRIIDIDADDDGRSPFDVSVLQSDRRVVDITLDLDGSVVRTEVDD